MEIAEDDPHGFHDAEPTQRVEGFERVVEETIAIEDPRHSLTDEQLIAGDFVPQGLDLADLGEKPVAADVHPAAFKDHTSGDASDDIVRLEDHSPPLELAEFERRRQPRGSGADNHRHGIASF